MNVGESAAGDLGRALTKDFPVGGAIDRLAVALEQFSDLQQNLLFLLGDGAVGFGTDVER